MATQSLNPNATAFQPSFNWTVMNRPRFNSLCRYHSHDSGNRCHFGNACWYVHAQELHRPTLAEQTASLLCAVHAILSFAVSLLAQHTVTTAVPGFADEQKTGDAANTVSDEPTQSNSARAHSQDAAPHLAHDDAQPASEKRSTMVSYDHIDQKDAVDDQNIGLHFEDHIEAKVDIEDETPNHTDAYLRIQAALTSMTTALAFEDAPRADVDLKLDEPQPLLETSAKHKAKPSAQETERLWRYVLGNNPQQLLSKYPSLLNEFKQQHYLGDMDAVLCGLQKKPELNNQPVVVKGYDQSKQRFTVELDYLSVTPKMLLIKNENLSLMRTHPLVRAVTHFKSSIEPAHWKRWPLGFRWDPPCPTRLPWM